MAISITGNSMPLALLLPGKICRKAALQALDSVGGR